MLNNKFKIYLFIVFSFLLIEQSNAQKGKRIELLNARVLKGGGELGADIKRLIGDVQFKHEGAIMYCDSAHFNSVSNTVDAYSNVHIVQNDSLNLYGDYLNYDGNTKLAKVRDNVILIHGDSKLYTDFLDYDRNTNTGKYFNHGHIIDVNNDLQSDNGYYYTNEKDYYAIDSVVLINPQYTMYTDTLRYNTSTDISYFYGPTEIISDSNYIYCENGWYDTKNDVSQFNKNAFLQTGEKTLSGDSLYYERTIGFGEAFYNVKLEDTTQKVILEGNYAVYFEKDERATITDSALMIQISNNDSLYLHSDTIKLVTFFDTIIFVDTINMSPFLIEGNLVADSIIENDIADDTLAADTTKGKQILSKIIDIVTFNNDDDSLQTDTIVPIVGIQNQNADSVNTLDSILVLNILSDTIIIDSLGHKLRIREYFVINKRKEIYAYNKVRIFKSDLQAKCDSLAYLSADSVLKFFVDPILWSSDNQISGETIDLHMANSEADYFVLTKKAMIVSEEDSIRFDQISGKKIIGHFRNNDVYKVDVIGNSESVYFPREEAPKEDTLITTDTLSTDSVITEKYAVVEDEKKKGDLIGANIAKGSSMVIYLENSKPIKIVFKKNSEGTFNPIEYVTIDKLTLKNFKWEIEKRPVDKDDIYNWR